MPAQAAATVNIADNEARVTLSAPDATASENGTDRARFVVTRTGPTTSALTVTYTIGGTATAGADYQALSGTVIIAAGSTSATIWIEAIPDTVIESTETVIITLVDDTGYKVGATAQRTANINHLGQPDLTITDIAYTPATYSLSTPGQTLDLDIDYANLGPIAANLVTIEIRLSINSVFGDADDYVLTITTLSIDALDSGTLSLLIPLDAAPLLPAPGAYHLAARIDPGRRFGEMDETNNDFFSPLADIVLEA
jgi:hypothetical protein